MFFLSKRFLGLCLCTIIITTSIPMIEVSIFPQQHQAVAGRASSRSATRSSGSVKTTKSSDKTGKKSSRDSGDSGSSSSFGSASRGPSFRPSTASSSGKKAIARATALNNNPRSTPGFKVEHEKNIAKSTKLIAPSDVIQSEHLPIMSTYNKSFKEIKSIPLNERVDSNPRFVTASRQFSMSRNLLLREYPYGYYPDDFEGNYFPLDEAGNMRVVEEENLFWNWCLDVIVTVVKLILLIALILVVFFSSYFALKVGGRTWGKLKEKANNRLEHNRRR
jgi:hypothetical protein